MGFRKDFVWGAATAAYQVEGAWDIDDKGASVWDMLCHQKGKIADGDNGDTACDHYHRYKGDIAIMQLLGMKAYRLSISWPRVFPQGTGSRSEKGIAFYERLIDELLGAGIEPWVTLFHWDYPYHLYLKGGWLNPESPKWFADYTALVVDKLSDRVSNWITLNEPQCFVGLGHLVGEHAPGLKLGLSEVLLAGHNVLLAHGHSVQAIRSVAKNKPSIGWAPVGSSRYPFTDSPEDIEAARRATFAVSADHLWSNSWWGDPIVLGCYPEEGLKAFGEFAPKFTSKDFEIIKQPLDFYGCNTYHGVPVTADTDGNPRCVSFPAGHPQSHFSWKITPQSLYWTPKFLAERYNLPIVLTENGMSNCDWVGLDGRIHDSGRIDYLQRYLLQLRRAVDDGVDIRGYFQWSLLDNFEWAEGYKQRFGLVHVDFKTQVRTVKDSAMWYSEVIRTNGSNLG